MGNTAKSAAEFPLDLKTAFPKEFGGIKNVGYVCNPATIPVWSDILTQMPFDELGMIGTPSMRLVSYIRECCEAAKAAGNSEFEIYIVAHSEGTAIVKNALPLIAADQLKHLRILSIGCEKFIPEDDPRIGKVVNISGFDPVPMLSPFNYVHGDVHNGQYHGPEWADGHARKWYIQALKDRGGIRGLPGFFIER